MSRSLLLLEMGYILHFTVPDVSKDHSVLIFNVKKPVSPRNGLHFTFYCSRRFEKSQCVDL